LSTTIENVTHASLHMDLPIHSNEAQQNPTAAPSVDPYDLSGDEISSLTTLAGDPAEQTHDAAKHRYKYECCQTIYRWSDSEGTSSIAPGMTVRCHDIGTKGISFFSPECPDFQRLIISLGKAGSPVFMAAEIVYSKVVCMH